MKTVIGVGFSIPSNEDDYLDFDSKGSLSDADVVIIDPDFYRINNYSVDSGTNNYQGKTLYSMNSSFKIKEHQVHWSSELEIFLKAGKTIFVMLTEKHDFFVHSGRKETSGTGRNQKITNIVEEYCNYKFLPSQKIKINNATGSKIYPIHSIIKNLNDLCKDYFAFQAYIENTDDLTPLFATKSNDKILGAVLNIYAGHFVFIPKIEFPGDFVGEDDNYTKEAVKVGERFKVCLIEISNSLKNEIQKSPPPEWTKSIKYNLADSESTKQLILEKQVKLNNLQSEIDSLNASKKEQESLKDLLYSTGGALELSVIKALTILGYTAENFNNGKLEIDQVIISPEGERFIGECEGKDNKDIDISKFRQLSDSLNEDFARDEVSDKAFGILFGNPQRLIEPNKRTLDFTDKCKRAAEREKIALIKTSDLFEAAKYALENKDQNFCKKCRDEIKRQLGSVVKFPS